MFLNYDESKWEEKSIVPVNTLQLFVTNKCNLRCKGCFVEQRLNTEEMSLETYKRHILDNNDLIQKVIIMGGEPTLHKDLLKMIDFNRSLNLKTTIYTNGINLKLLDSDDLNDIEVRVGVYGAFSSEKPLSKIQKVNRPLTIVHMLRKDNVDDLKIISKMVEDFNCNKFFISSIRDTVKTHDYWKDTEDTITPNDYAKIVQDFIDNYNGTIKELHISRRGVLESRKNCNTEVCRFGNIFTNGDKIICPFDIASKIMTDKLEFGTRKCNKRGCILQKIVLKRI
jgi:MoaA/NifB/PqqE/SkfB family radical SAM enzyme